MKKFKRKNIPLILWLVIGFIIWVFADVFLIGLGHLSVATGVKWWHDFWIENIVLLLFIGFCWLILWICRREKPLIKPIFSEDTRDTIARVLLLLVFGLGFLAMSVYIFWGLATGQKTTLTDIGFAIVALVLAIMILSVLIFNHLPKKVKHYWAWFVIIGTIMVFILFFTIAVITAIVNPKQLWEGRKPIGSMLILAPIVIVLVIFATRDTLKKYDGKLTWSDFEDDDENDKKN